MEKSKMKTQLVDVSPEICQLTLQTLSSHAKTFRHVDKEEEPPLRVLDHGLPYEGLKASEAPYPHMIKKGSLYYHGYRFDQALCDKACHTTPLLRSIFGHGESQARAYFRSVLGYAPPGSPFTSVDGGVLSNELHNAFMVAALKVYGEEKNEEARRLSRIYSVYANILLPGQIVALHLDVPEFLGADRTSTPSWLLVAAHCSGRFEASRVRNVTCVYYPATAKGGALAVYPPIQGGGDEPRNGQVVAAAEGCGVVMEADSCFHHSEQVRHGEEVEEVEVPKLPDRCSLEVVRKNEGGFGEVVWVVRDDNTGEEIGRYNESQLRISVSCRIHVFGSQEEVQAFENKQDKTLSGSTIIERLTQDLQSRGRLGKDNLPFYELGPLLVDEYVLPYAPNSCSIENLWSTYHTIKSENK